MTTKYRKKVQQACESLGKELDKHENIRFPSCVSDALWWLSTEETLQGILRKLIDFNNLEYVDEEEHENN